MEEILLPRWAREMKQFMSTNSDDFVLMSNSKTR